MSVIAWNGVQLKTTDCYKCGCTFGMPERFFNDRLKDRADFYCPNGHCQHFIGKSEADKLRESLHAERVRVMELQEKALTLEARRRAAKAQLTKLKNRIDNGMCPYCKRHFENVQRHISCKHKQKGVGEGSGATEAP